MTQDGEDEPLPREERIRRQVGRTIANWTAILVSLAIIVGWGVTGFYELEPGEGAVILRIGRYDRTEEMPGLRWHLPPPLESHEKVNLREIRREKFGLRPGSPAPAEGEAAAFDTAIQTADSNIVNLSYVVQYRVADAFPFLYGLADPTETLRDAAQASVREVVGRKTIDEVLSTERGAIQDASQETLQTTLDSYFDHTRFANSRAFEIDRVVLQIVQPPGPVQDAFDDVIAAQQDAGRAASEAQGDAKEIRERASAQARELRERANGYKEATILEAKGEADRWLALYEEYARAPDVTRRRLYLETMEEIMPSIEKLVIEPDTVSLMPFLPSRGGAKRLPPVATAPAAPTAAPEVEP